MLLCLSTLSSMEAPCILKVTLEDIWWMSMISWSKEKPRLITPSNTLPLPTKQVRYYLLFIFSYFINISTIATLYTQIKNTETNVNQWIAGEYSLLPMGVAKGYCCVADGWMLEYARGVVPLGLPYFICSAFFVTVDVVPWLTATWKVGTAITYNLLVNRKI